MLHVLKPDSRQETVVICLLLACAFGGGIAQALDFHHTLSTSIAIVGIVGFLLLIVRAVRSDNGAR